MLIIFHNQEKYRKLLFTIHAIRFVPMLSRSYYLNYSFYLDEKLKINSTLRWEYSVRFYLNKKPYDGTYVSFECSDYYQWELNGPQTITCTSHGNYSAAPPTCKKRPKKETDSSSSSKFTILCLF